MVNNNRWGDFKGAIANLVSPGKVYNTHTNSYAPRNVTIARLLSGAASQMGPLGSVVGALGGMVSNRMDGAQAFDRGLSVSKDLRGSIEAPYNPGVSLPAISGVSGVGGGMQGFSGGGVGGSYGPSAFSTGGYHFANPSANASTQAPGGFANGIFNGGAGNFGPTGATGGGPVQGAGGHSYANQAQMNASIAAAQDQFSAMKMGDLNKNFQTGKSNNVLGTGGTYLK